MDDVQTKRTIGATKVIQNPTWAEVLAAATAADDASPGITVKAAFATADPGHDGAMTSSPAKDEVD